VAISNLPARPVEAPVAGDRLEHLEQWRTAARRVTRAWEQWLACDAAERDWAHTVYVDALAREEAAAIRLERDARAVCEP
jgi:hypothetical protein